MAISKKLGKIGWDSCKYKISVDLTFGDKSNKKLQDVQIIGLYLEKDYDNDHLPIMMLDLAISKIDFLKIDDDTIFHVKIDQYYIHNDDDVNEKKYKKNFIDDKFIRMDIDNNFDTTEELDKLVRKTDGMSDDDLAPSDLTSQKTFVLVKKSDLSLTKKIVNCVLSGVTQEDVVCWALTETKCPNKVLMSNFTNKKVFDQLLLLPMPLMKQLIYLESEYGWYKEGTYIFLDYDTFYIIRKNGEFTAWRKNEEPVICFCINDDKSSDTASNGIIKDNFNIFINVGTKQYRLVDASMVEDQTTGTNMILVNTSDGSSKVIKSDTKTLDGGSYVTKMHHGHNPYIESQYKRMKKENDHIWEITCNNIDISCFTPNKMYGFVSDVTKINKKLQGKYRISSIKTSFVKNGNTFNNTSIIRVKRTSL